MCRIVLPDVRYYCFLRSILSSTLVRDCNQEWRMAWAMALMERPTYEEMTGKGNESLVVGQMCEQAM